MPDAHNSRALANRARGVKRTSPVAPRANISSRIYRFLPSRNTQRKLSVWPVRVSLMYWRRRGSRGSICEPSKCSLTALVVRSRAACTIRHTSSRSGSRICSTLIVRAALKPPMDCTRRIAKSRERPPANGARSSSTPCNRRASSGADGDTKSPPPATLSENMRGRPASSCKRSPRPSQSQSG